MSEPCTPRFSEMIDAAFVGSLSANDWNVLRAHLLDCEACRSYHDRLALVDYALAENAEVPAAVRDRIEGRVLAGLIPPERPSFWGRWLVPALAGAAAAAIAAIVVFQPPPDRDEYIARGGQHSFEGRPPGVAVFCIEPPGRVTATARAQGVLACALDRELQLAYSSPRGAPLYLAVYGENDRGEAFWYAPAKPSAELVEMKPDAVDEPLPHSTRLAVKHQPGKYRLVARFFATKRTGEAAKAARDAVSEVVVNLEITKP